MSINEQQRRLVYDGLESAFGDEFANSLMELLPYQPAASLVTREDLHANTAVTRGEMAELRSDLKGEMAELRAELKGEMAELRAELKGEMAELRGEFRALEARVESKIEAGVAQIQVSTQRMFMAALATNTIAVIAALAT